MASKLPTIFSSFSSGWASDIKIGPERSFYYSRHLDFRKSPSQMSILPATTKESALIVTGLITDMIQLPSGLCVAIDSSGGVYTRSTGGTWTKNGTVLSSTAYGMFYNLQQDTIYIPGTTTLHSITNADGRFGGAFTVNEGVIGASQDQSSLNGHAQIYTTTGSITETTVNKLSITPTIEPLYSVKLWVVTKGSVSITVTMHDAANNTLGTSTLLAAAITNGAYNEFVFSTPVRMLVKPNGATYHFHVTNSSGTASTIGTSTVSDLSTGDYQSWSNRFVNPVNGFHPCIDFLQYALIGNERYLSVWEVISQSSPANTEYLRHRLTFPSGYSVTSMALYSSYVAIACEKRSTSATNEFQDGKIFFWDGTSTTYNFIIDVPEGSPYGIQAHKNRLYWFANNSWWAWAGGNPVKVFQMPNTDFEFTGTNTYSVNYPHTMAVRNGILLGAFPSETNSTAIEHAVYSFGQRNKNYSESFGYSYSMSTGSRVNTGSNNLRLGMVKSFGDKLFISWRDDSQAVGAKFGVDKIDPNSTPFTTATWESLIMDSQVKNARPDNDKQATYLNIVFKPLPTGATITPKYKINRESSWNLGSTAVAGDTFIRLNINKRYKELQVGFDATATLTTPEILAIIPLSDPLKTEED